jgi:RNA-directed DNA polymerase
VPERATVLSRSEKSAAAIVAGGTRRRAKRGGVFKDMAMQKVRRQMPAQAGREGDTHGEAVREPASDETSCPRHETKNIGPSLLTAALARENLQRALKRVKANKGAAGVDGLDIEQTIRHLVTAWPTIREQLLAGTYRPSNGSGN